MGKKKRERKGETRERRTGRQTDTERGTQGDTEREGGQWGENETVKGRNRERGECHREIQTAIERYRYRLPKRDTDTDCHREIQKE